MTVAKQILRAKDIGNNPLPFHAILCDHPHNNYIVGRLIPPPRHNSNLLM